MANEKEMVKILLTFKFLIVNPLVTETANESIDKPIAINTIAKVSIYFILVFLT